MSKWRLFDQTVPIYSVKNPAVWVRFAVGRRGRRAVEPGAAGSSFRAIN